MDFRGLANALECPIHPDICTYYGSYWSGSIEAESSEGHVSLIQLWNPEDFDRLIENLIGHALMKQKSRHPFTVFFATTEADSELFLSVENQTGRVFLEEPGKAPLRCVDEDLATFLDRLTGSTDSCSGAAWHILNTPFPTGLPMKHLTLAPIDAVSGEISLPGSKSLTNRALLLAALARGKTRLENLLVSDDSAQMIGALDQLGVSLSASDGGHSALVEGNGGLFPPPDNTSFFLGNAGTAIRPLTSVLSLIPGVFELDGDKYLRERPIAHLGDALEQLGTEVTYLNSAGFPPLRIVGGRVKGGAVSIPGNISSQYLTSLLLALPLADNDSTIRVVGEQVSKPYLDITTTIMQDFGVTVSHNEYQHFQVPGGQQYVSPGTYLIEGDASSATYFFAAAAIAGDVRVKGIGKGSVQGDVQFLDTIEQMGAHVERHDAEASVTRGSLSGIDVDLNHIPDAAMTIAVMALFADGPTRIRNVYNWRVKETDRMHAMATELKKLGADVSTTEDSITIHPPPTIRSARIDTYGDHRMAMCFSLAALGDAPITINDPDCTRKTFPDYFDVFGSICR